MHPHRQLVGVGLGLDRPRDRQLLLLIVEAHRQAERQRREAFRLARRQPAEGRILDQAGNVAHAQAADFKRLDPSDLESAQSNFSDTGGLHGRDRLHAAAPRHIERNHGPFGAGIEEKLLPAAVDLARHHDFVATNPDRNGPRRGRRRRVDVERHAALERLQEPDLGAGPTRLLAALLVRQQIDVAPQRTRRIVELPKALVNGGDGVMKFGVPRAELDGSLCVRQRVGQAIACRKRPCPAVQRAWLLGTGGESGVIRCLRFLETPVGPEGVATQRCERRVGGNAAREAGRYFERLTKIARAKERDCESGPGTKG